MIPPNHGRPLTRATKLLMVAHIDLFVAVG
jgi:hypothetical protein